MAFLHSSDMWAKHAPGYTVSTNGKQVTGGTLSLDVYEYPTLPSRTPDSTRTLHVVFLQPVDGQPRAVTSGHCTEDVSLPFPHLGEDPLLAGKYALVERTAVAVQTALAAEAIGIGLQSGLDASILYDAIAGAAGSSWSFRTHGREMLGLGCSTPGQSLEEARVALEDALGAAERNKFYAPFASLAKQIYTVTPTIDDGFQSSASVSQTWRSSPTYANGVEVMGPATRVKPTRIGFVGLGAMGLGMANVLRDHGLDVVGYDAWAPSSARFAAGGGCVAGSMADCARGSDILILMVINATQAEQVLFEQRALEDLPTNATVLMMCTVSPSQAVALADRVHTARPDVGFVDSPVSGGTPRAASGDLTILASGLPKNAGKSLYVLDHLSGTLGNHGNLFIIPGGPGMGAAIKLVNQHLAGSHIASTAETLGFAASLGLPLRRTRELLLEGPAQTWMMGHRGKHMLDGLIQPPTSTIDIFVKDTSIVANESRRLGFPAPLIALVQQHFILASACGWGRDDDCGGLIRLWIPSGVNVVCA